MPSQATQNGIDICHLEHEYNLANRLLTHCILSFNVIQTNIRHESKHVY